MTDERVYCIAHINLSIGFDMHTFWTADIYPTEPCGPKRLYQGMSREEAVKVADNYRCEHGDTPR